MKKILWILSLSLLIFTACGKKDSAKADDKSASSGNVELVFWHGIESPDSVAILESKIKEFESKNPGITVKAQNYGAADQVNGKIMTAIAGNKAPEVLLQKISQISIMLKTCINQGEFYAKLI